MEKRLYEKMRRTKKTREQNRTIEFSRREERREEKKAAAVGEKIAQPVCLEACTNPDKLQQGTSMLQSIKTH